MFTKWSKTCSLIPFYIFDKQLVNGKNDQNRNTCCAVFSFVGVVDMLLNCISYVENRNIFRLHWHRSIMITNCYFHKRTLLQNGQS